MSAFISCVAHGVYGVSPEDIPLCLICDQPMSTGESITLQTCDIGPGQLDLLRLVHSMCDEEDEDEDEDEDND